MRLSVYVRAVRLPFLTGSLFPVVVATALAYLHDHTWNFLRFGLIALGVAALQLGANLINDYYDWDSSDRANRFGTPFSGGSRVRLDGLIRPRAFLAMGIALLAIALGLGVALALLGRPWVPAIGLAGALGGILYSERPFQLVSRGAGEFVIFVCFGPLITLGTGYAIEGVFTLPYLLLGLPMGFLVANILWVNEFPDIEADGRAGKRTLVVRLGTARARWGYVVLLSGFAASVVALFAFDLVPPWFLAALLAAAAAIPAVRNLWRNHADPKAIVPSQAATIKVQALAGVLMVAAIAVEHWV